MEFSGLRFYCFSRAVLLWYEQSEKRLHICNISGKGTPRYNFQWKQIKIIPQLLKRLRRKYAVIFYVWYTVPIAVTLADRWVVPTL